MNNRKRLKKLILANKETRWLYRMMQFLAIFMVVSCLVIITLAKWIEYDQNKKREELFGSWDEVFLNVDQEDLNYFRKNAFLEEISVQSIQEKVFLEEDQRVVIGACDENFLEMGNIELLEGRMPKYEKEVAVEEEYLNVLGVSSVGDIVPDNSKVESLRGYRLTGIVGNYASHWKMINSSVKYLNCFVKKGEYVSLNVFVKYGIWSLRDPEINLIEYKRNFEKVEVDYNEMIAEIGILCVMIQLLLIFKILKHVKVISMNNINKSNLKLMSKISYILILLNILLSIAICGLINDFYNDRIVITVKSEDIVLEAVNRIHKIAFHWNSKENYINQFKALDYEFDINIFTSTLISILWIILILFLIINLTIYRCNLKVSSRKNYYWLIDYYSNIYIFKSAGVKKELIIQSIIRFLSVLVISLYTFYGYKEYMETEFFIKVFSYYFISLLFIRNIIYLFVKSGVIKNNTSEN